MTTPAILAKWLVQVGEGDRAALKSIYNATSAKLFAVTLRILIDRSEAEDVLQEVFITIWRKAAQFDAVRAGAMTWLVTIARNRAIDRLRSRPARTNVAIELAAEIADERPLPDAILEAGGEAAKLQTALSMLDPRHAGIIRAAFFEGLSYEALAMREAVPVGTLKSWVRRGLLRMRSELAT